MPKTVTQIGNSPSKKGKIHKMSGENFNYKSGIKNNWRRAVWNRITERITVKSRDAVVLYLAGKEDLDRPIAKAKGFRDENLIAVEKRQASVGHLRSGGVNTISADLVETIASWAGQDVHVILADFCCGFNSQLLHLSNPLKNKWFEDCVIAINLMRGRDKWKNEWDVDETYNKCIRGTHRARSFYEFIKLGSQHHFHTALAQNPEPAVPDSRLEWLQKCDSVCRPWFSSYMSSSGQVFDSGVFINPNELGYSRREYEKVIMKLKNSLDHAKATTKDVPPQIMGDWMKMVTEIEATVSSPLEHIGLNNVKKNTDAYKKCVAARAIRTGRLS